MLIGFVMENKAKKILIADTNETFRASLRVFLQGLGHEVREATNGDEIICTIAADRPDLILMDVQLPGMNGDEIAVQLKRNMATRNIPLLISAAWSTACNIEARISRALTAGAEEILYKPFQLPMLRNVLRSYLFA